MSKRRLRYATVRFVVSYVSVQEINILRYPLLLIRKEAPSPKGKRGGGGDEATERSLRFAQHYESLGPQAHAHA